MRRVFLVAAVVAIVGAVIGVYFWYPSTANLVLILPESADPPKHAPERVTMLTIDGHDYTLPRSTRRHLFIEPAAGKDKITIEYSFWPNTYTNIIRTKVVPHSRSSKTDVDLTREDSATPDKIKPIYFPTPNEVVEAMLKLGDVGPDDVVHDIGSGDGRLVIMAVKKFNAKKGFGIDIEEYLVDKSRENARKEGVEGKVEFRAGDALELKDFSEASVVLLYIGTDLNLKLRPLLQKTLKPGSRVVSHRFKMGDWTPDRSVTIKAKNNYDEMEQYELHLWTIK